MTFEQMIEKSETKKADRKQMINCICRWGGKANTKMSTDKLTSLYKKYARIEAEKKEKELSERKTKNRRRNQRRRDEAHFLQEKKEGSAKNVPRYKAKKKMNVQDLVKLPVDSIQNPVNI